MIPTGSRHLQPATNRTNLYHYGFPPQRRLALILKSLVLLYRNLSFVPQFSIAPKDVGGFDRRFFSDYVPEYHDDMGIKENDVCRLAVVFFDPAFEVDRRNVDLIKAAAPRVKQIYTHKAGHAAIELFAGTDTTQKLFTLGRLGDTAALQRLSTERAKTSPVCRRQIITRILERRSISLGLAAFEKSRSDFTDRQAAQFMSGAAREYLNNSNVLAAEQMIAQALELQPADALLMSRMSTIQEASNSFEASLYWAKKALEANDKEARQFAFLAKLQLRLGKRQDAFDTLKKGLAVDPGNRELKEEFYKLSMR